MKINEIKSLIPPFGVKVLTFGRFTDDRGYFTETHRKSDFMQELGFNLDLNIMQTNESYSKKGVVRGLHFQWNPFMGKLVRTIMGRMIDMFLDIRKDSETYGKIFMYDMPSKYDDNKNEWIWIPPGFAHGNVFTEDTVIEYFCSGEYSPGCEAGINPLSEDIDWSLCNQNLKDIFCELLRDNSIILSEKDRKGLTLLDWSKRNESNLFRMDL